MAGKGCIGEHGEGTNGMGGGQGKGKRRDCGGKDEQNKADVEKGTHEAQGDGMGEGTCGTPLLLHPFPELPSLCALLQLCFPNTACPFPIFLPAPCALSPVWGRGTQCRGEHRERVHGTEGEHRKGARGVKRVWGRGAGRGGALQGKAQGKGCMVLGEAQGRDVWSEWSMGKRHMGRSMGKGIHRAWGEWSTELEQCREGTYRSGKWFRESTGKEMHRADGV